MLFAKEGETTYSGTDQNADFFCLFAFGLPTGVVQRHGGARDCKGDELVDSSGLFTIQPIFGVEIANFRRNLRRKLAISTPKIGWIVKRPDESTSSSPLQSRAPPWR